MEDLIKSLPLTCESQMDSNGVTLFVIHIPSVHSDVTWGCSALRPMVKVSQAKKGQTSTSNVKGRGAISKMGALHSKTDTFWYKESWKPIFCTPGVHALSALPKLRHCLFKCTPPEAGMMISHGCAWKTHPSKFISTVPQKEYECQMKMPVLITGRCSICWVATVKHQCWQDTYSYGV